MGLEKELVHRSAQTTELIHIIGCATLGAQMILYRLFHPTETSFFSPLLQVCIVLFLGIWEKTCTRRHVLFKRLTPSLSFEQ